MTLPVDTRPRYGRHMTTAPAPDDTFWTQGRLHVEACWETDRGPDGGLRRIHAATCAGDPAPQPRQRPLPPIPPASKANLVFEALGADHEVSEGRSVLAEARARALARQRDARFLRDLPTS